MTIQREYVHKRQPLNLTCTPFAAFSLQYRIAQLQSLATTCTTFCNPNLGIHSREINLVDLPHLASLKHLQGGVVGATR